MRATARMAEQSERASPWMDFNFSAAPAALLGKTARHSRPTTGAAMGGARGGLPPRRGPGAASPRRFLAEGGSDGLGLYLRAPVTPLSTGLPGIAESRSFIPLCCRLAFLRAVC